MMQNKRSLAFSSTTQYRHRRPALAVFLSSAITFLLISCSSVNGADPVTEGHDFPAMTLEDQHGNSYSLPGNYRTILFTADMEGGKIIQEFLEEKSEDYLENHAMAYVADVHRMPALITRLAAIPRMRGYPYNVLLIREGIVGSQLPRKEEQVTVIEIEDNTINAIEYATDIEELSTMLNNLSE